MCRAMSRDIGTGLWVTVNAGLMTPPLFEAIIVLYLAFTLTLRGNNIHDHILLTTSIINLPFVDW
jgi:hypothetical protein